MSSSLKLDPEPEGAFEALAALKDELDVNIELAAPDQFIPPLARWRERSRYIGTWGMVDFFHYEEIRGELIRYPAIDASAFETKLRQFVAMLAKP